MPRQQKHFEINGQHYHLTQLGALEGRRLWLKLAKVVAGPLRELANAANANEATIMQVVAGIVENLNEEVEEELMNAFGRSCTVRVGERTPYLEGVIFDEHFAGDYVAMSKWFGECVVFNFASFLGDGALGKLSDLASKAAPKSLSRKESTGGSGESSPTTEPR